MKKILFLSIVMSLSTAFAAKKGTKTETFLLNPEKTTIEWIGTKVTGEHKGLVKIKDGSKLTLKGDEITSGNIVVDLNSMTVTDITDPEYVTKFLGHMKSADFFDIEKYPEATLVINKSKKTAAGLEVEGQMTILGKTQPIKFVSKTTEKNKEVFKSEATLKIDRTKFGLKYGSGQFFKGLGDKMIHDDFTLNIKLEAKKL